MSRFDRKRDYGVDHEVWCVTGADGEVVVGRQRKYVDAALMADALKIEWPQHDFVIRTSDGVQMGYDTREMPSKFVGQKRIT